MHHQGAIGVPLAAPGNLPVIVAAPTWLPAAQPATPSCPLCTGSRHCSNAGSQAPPQRPIHQPARLLPRRVHLPVRPPHQRLTEPALLPAAPTGSEHRSPPLPRPHRHARRTADIGVDPLQAYAIRVVGGDWRDGFEFPSMRPDPGARRRPRPHLAAARHPSLVRVVEREDSRIRHLEPDGWLAYMCLEDPPGLSPITATGRYDTVEAAQAATDEVWASR
jgi:hypothetical protein